MALQDFPGLDIQVDQATTLPDPTTVSGRQNAIYNTALVAVAITSSGPALPFTVGGVNVASISLGAGQVVVLQSDGVRWQARSSGFNRSIYAATGVTAASGDVTFTFPVGFFAVAPVVDIAYQGAAAVNPVDFRITALTATSCTVNVRISIGITVALLGLTLLGTSTPLSGAIIHLIATNPGGTP